MSLLEVRQLSFSYHQTAGASREPVLNQLSFSLDAGELLAVVGPNGVGKSTLFRCVLGLLDGWQGDILIDGCPLAGQSRRELAASVAYVPQTHPATFGYTVLEMVLMGTSAQFDAWRSPGRLQHQRAGQALARLGISSLARRNFMALSGGEQQLVLIARAMAQEAKLIVMDEPTANLDYGNQLRVLTAVRQLTRSGLAVLLSTHNPNHALWFADRVLALKNGRLDALDRPAAVLTPQRVEALFGVAVQLQTAGPGPDGTVSGLPSLIPRLPAPAAEPDADGLSQPPDKPV
ncbi:MAG: ABC transporter ATP-binding protein [Oscillospiraceae bacterium]|nr:ABC transporter ATP-binding protein [Oscillospiraceae bacterium]MDD4368763.1 ABC transporter ATP-binding protein [Oscillospiraceae bacterium]